VSIFLLQLQLLYLGHRRSALGAASLIVFGLCCWFLFTRSIGLPILPSSVLLKSDIAANATEHGGGLAQLSRAIVRNVLESITGRQGILLILALIVVLILSCSAWRKKQYNIAIVIGGLTIFTGLAHIFGGHYGWFNRYEIYVETLVMISALVLGRSYLIKAEVKYSVLFGCLLVIAPYIRSTFLTPKAAQNIYQQQYQMHRFAVEYWKQPIAVNDLGWVSYNNSSYVLDLYGLGSEEVRRLRMTGGEGSDAAKTLFTLVERRHVLLIMIYDNWFNKIPAAWQKVAILNTSQVTAASDKVSFYITPAAPRTHVLDLLHKFGKTLPKGAYLSTVY